MYYSSTVPISASPGVEGLLCPGCELCCDVIYCGELKFENGIDIVADKKKKKKKNKKEGEKIIGKERRGNSSVTSTKIIEAIRDVQQRAIYLQRKLRAMEKVKFEAIKSCGRKERIRKTPKTDHRSCYCPTNPRDEKRHSKKSEPIKIKLVKNYADAEPEEKLESENATTTTRVEKEFQETETQTETTSSSDDKNSRGFDKGDVEDETRRGSFFGGCAPCGLTCGFRYEKENDSATSDVISARGENKKSRGCSPPGTTRGSYHPRSRSRRRLTGVRSFPGGKSSNIIARRTWCCC